MKVKYTEKATARYRLKKFIYTLYAFSGFLYLLSALKGVFHKKKNYRYYVSLCLIFKDEAPYLREWIEYHLLIGVEHFYLYNNKSSDHYLEVLQPYIDRGIVTLYDWPKDYGQVDAYNHCYEHHSSDTHWLGIIDADEFVNLTLKGGDDIGKLLKKYELYPSLYMFWRIFGTSGEMKEDHSKLVTEQYTSCWPFLCSLGKSFINNDWKFKSLWLHCEKGYYHKISVPAVNDNFTFNPGMIVFPLGNYQPKVYINHYWSRSREYSLYKVYKKTDAFGALQEKMRKESGVNGYELKCTTKDFSIQRWLVLLKEKLI